MVGDGPVPWLFRTGKKTWGADSSFLAAAGAIPGLGGNNPLTKCDIHSDGHTPDFSRFIEKRLQRRTENLHAEAVGYLEQFLIRRVLQETGGNQSQAARILGITRGNLRNKVRAFGISIDHVINTRKEELLPLA
jgi:hypothetical protein